MRRPRIELAGGIHHVFARTPSKLPLFRDDVDRQIYVARFGAEARERDWDVYTFCLMRNHVHWVIGTPDTDLGKGIHAAHGAYARHVHARHGVSGHVFGGRFENKLVLVESYLVALLRYVARNPVPVACASPDDWGWSAHRALAGLDPAPSFLAVDKALSVLGPTTDAARLSYRALVAHSDEEILEALAASTGDDSWMIRAVDAFRIEIPTLAAFLGFGRTKTYALLAAARAAAD